MRKLKFLLLLILGLGSLWAIGYWTHPLQHKFYPSREWLLYGALGSWTIAVAYVLVCKALDAWRRYGPRFKEAASRHPFAFCGLVVLVMLVLGAAAVKNLYVGSFTGDLLSITNIAVFNVKDFGAIGDGHIVNTGSMTSNSATLTVTGSPFTSADVGKVITVYGGGRKPTGFTTTNQALNLTGTILSTNNANQVVISTNCQQTITSAHVIWGTDDTAAINRGLHYACTNTSGAGGTLFFPAGYYIVNGAPIDTNMTQINTAGWLEPKNAQIWFPDWPGSVGAPVQQTSVTLEGPTATLINQADQSIDSAWTNKSAVLCSTYADLNGASVISCIATNPTTRAYANLSFRFWNGVNAFGVCPYHVEVKNIHLQTAGNPTGPALNLCGAGSVTLSQVMIDSGYTLYNVRGKPMNTNGIGFLGPTANAAGPTICDNYIICGFYTAVIQPEFWINRSAFIESSLYGVETTSGQSTLGDFWVGDLVATINNRTHAFSLWDAFISQENVNASGVWSYPGVLITNDSSAALRGAIRYKTSYGDVEPPFDCGLTGPKIQLFNLSGSAGTYSHYASALRATNFIGTVTSAAGGSDLKMGEVNVLFNNSGAGQQGDISLTANGDTGWTFGFNFNPDGIAPAYALRFKTRDGLQKVLAYIDKTGNFVAVSNVVGNSFMSAATNRAAITATGYTNTLTANGVAVNANVYFTGFTTIVKDANNNTVHSFTAGGITNCQTLLKPNWSIVGTGMAGTAIAQ